MQIARRGGNLMAQQRARSQAECTNAVQLNQASITSVFQNQSVVKDHFNGSKLPGGYSCNAAEHCEKVKLINQTFATIKRIERGMPMKMKSYARRPLSAGSRQRRHQVGTVTTLTAAVLTVLYGEPAAAATAPLDENALQEVVVTATRRALSAQNIPISITAVTGASLERAGITDISGLAHSMSGVNVTDKGPFGGVNGATLVIRGLNSEATGGQVALATPIVPPVATYVDDTALFVNLRLGDLDHVEILRGPQGTLYGSGSLGGTIRFVQNAPDPSAFDAKVEAGLSKTRHTHALNEDITGVLNLPITET